jgi:hypothetical protein
MEEIVCETVAEKFESYPDQIRSRLLFLRKLIFEAASESNVSDIEETLKWGEPSYVAKSGSTVRIDWKKSSPNQYAMYFNCNTMLVETFRELYKEQFRFVGNRAIVFDENGKIPVDELKHCIALALNYHRIKHLPMLGA